MTLADGRRAQADTFDALTAQAFGVPLPVAGLTYWIRGQPREGTASAIERDAAGRANVLRQDGWEIVYSYADDAATLPPAADARLSGRRHARRRRPVAMTAVA